ncbi:MAG: hypothetical protein J0H06_13190, partial [Actinobacteria bacterium]|nr:hypothetical protein [Actinomycetota bacterium]
MRLVRHLSFSNVIAVIALFIALGGAAYAGSKINGKNIVNKSIGGGKLKNETITANKIKKGTITSAQIAPGSIDSTQINISTLTTVPSATTATTATTAKTAETATTAKTAETATKATSAVTADEAGEAELAEEAEDANHAKEADRATTAGEAEKLGGKTVGQLTLNCDGTKDPSEAYGGMCWSKSVQPAVFWLVAVKECGDNGGRLPLIGELIAYLTHDGNTPGSEQEWSGSLLGPGKVLTSDDEEHVGEESSPIELGYRC